MKSFDEIRGKQKEQLVETETKPIDPPAMLLLRRKAIRSFSGHERVALYGNEKLGIEVSIPYKLGEKMHGVATAVKEEVQLDEGILDKLMHIFRTKKAGDVMFKNGSSARIDPQTAKRIIGLHKTLNRGNKMHLSDVINKGMSGVSKIANFAVTHHLLNN